MEDKQAEADVCAATFSLEFWVTAPFLGSISSLTTTLAGAIRLGRSLMARMILLGYLGPGAPLRKSTNRPGFFLGPPGLPGLGLLNLGGDLDLGGLLDLAGLPSLPGLPEFTGDPASLHVRSVPSSVTSTLLIDLTNVEIAGNLDRGPLAEGRISFPRRLKSLSKPSWMNVERSL